MEHTAGDRLVFTAQRRARLFGRDYRAGDEAEIILYAPFDDAGPGFGQGGPWGWGGFTAATLRRIGRLATDADR